jgi:hypothetical protein
MKIYNIFLFCLSFVFTFAFAHNNTFVIQELVDLEICEYNNDIERRNIIFEYKLKILDVVNSLMLYHNEVDSRPNDFTVFEHENTIDNFHTEIVYLENKRDTLIEKIKSCDFHVNELFDFEDQ